MRECAPKCFKFAAKAFHFCFKFAPNLRQFAPKAFHFCFKFAPNLPPRRTPRRTPCRSPVVHLSFTCRSPHVARPVVHLSFTCRSPVAHPTSHALSFTCRSPVVHLSLTCRSPPRDRRPPPTPLLYPIGAHQLGLRAEEPRLRGEALCFGMVVPAKWRGLPDCFRANHRRLSGSPGPPMKLRAGPQGTGELSRKWGSSEALPPPPGLCAWAGFSVPSGERNAAQILGSSGNETLPFFLQLPGDLRAPRAAPRSWPARPRRRGASR